jgi:hypothetical protein
MSHLGKGRGDGREEIRVGSAGEEVAHVRARFAVDPGTPARLADAWKAPTGSLEEDESELIDAVADCLSVGLPIDAAVASWRSGALVSDTDNQDGDDDEDTGVFDDAETGIYDPGKPGPRRRVVTS